MQYSPATMALINEPVRALRNRTNHELVGFVLERFHAVHREQLSELLELSEKIERVHADHPQTPTGLHLLLSRIARELEQHMMKEEQILFPMLLNGQYPTGPIMVMTSEHDEHEAAITQILDLTHQLTIPDDGCGTWRHLYAKLNEFINDIRAHIEIENKVLFVSEYARSGQCCGSCQ